MTRTHRCFAALLVLLSANTLVAESPSFGKQIKPFLDRYCTECHGQKDPDGDLRLDTYANLLKGGRKGPILSPGKPDASRLVLLVEKKGKPAMPPKRAKQPSSAEVALLRAWVTSGAKNDGIGSTVVLPKIAPRKVIAPPVTSVEYSPDGKRLAAGVGERVWLFDGSTHDPLDRTANLGHDVTALSFSPDGKTLAVAIGSPGQRGEVLLFSLGTPDSLGEPRQIEAHRDRIHDIVFSPDGKLLATSSYDRLIRLWNVADGKLVRDLKDHSDAVYAIAFSPDGKYLASSAADRAVKIWEIATGKRLYTLSENTDWVYAVAWSPDGKHVAAGGVDRSIRVWRVSPDEGNIAHSVFGHAGPITQLRYSRDGKSLYSVSEDRSAKSWNASTMVETHVFAKQPDAILDIAVRPDRKQLAFARYDGSLVLLDSKGKVQATPLPSKPKKPELTRLHPTTVQRGVTASLQLIGKHLLSVTSARTDIPGAKVQLSADQRKVSLTLPKTTPAGVYNVFVKNAAGESNPMSFTVDLFPTTRVDETASTIHGEHPIVLPTSVGGTIGQDGDVDSYRFEATKGQEIGVQVLAFSPAAKSKSPKLEPMVRILSPVGDVLAQSVSGALGYVCPDAGEYVLNVHDRDYRGNKEMKYRLHVGPIPIVTTLYPKGFQKGTEQRIHVEGVHLGATRSVMVKSAANLSPGAKVPVPLTTPWGKPLGESNVVVGEHPEVLASSDTNPLPVPGTANGRIVEPGAVDVWRFHAKKGHPLVLEVEADRLGSPLDSFVEILDAKGSLVPRAVLRSLANTYTTFRDHDSRKPGIRIESWSELAIDDYLLVGTELMRIKALPRNPDDDCRFYEQAGRRQGFLGTTPTFHPPGVPMYKVSLHPPGTTFPPNGLPVVTLYYRNDDGTRKEKDSYLLFDPPADGEYQVRIGDSRSQGSPQHIYRLTVQPARPRFTVTMSPKAPAISKGSALPIRVNVVREDGFDGPVDVELQNLPKGLSAPETSIPASENSTSFALYAEPDAKLGEVKPLSLVASATIQDKVVSTTTAGGKPRLLEPGDIVTTTVQDRVDLVPGSKIRIVAKIERRNGFKGRVPLDVQGLPQGVRVLNVGLNGILITEKETQRSIVIYAEPWTQPTETPLVVFAKREGKNTEHAARSVLLRVVPNK